MHLSCNPSAPQLLERGIYIMPYLGPNGEMILAAINRRGERTIERLMGSDERQEAVEDELCRQLDQNDPPFSLQIVA